jgi:hypothetical protein
MMIAEFDIVYDKAYKVRLTRTINGKNDYAC